MSPRHVLYTSVLVLSCSAPAIAQNGSFATAANVLVGQTPARVVLTAASPTRYYLTMAVQGRSYCVEASGAEGEANYTDPILTVFAADQTTVLGTDNDTQAEPRGLSAARVCFIASTSGNFFIELKPNTTGPIATDAEYTMRVVETTLWANWFFVGGDYSSFTLVRNTTNSTISATLSWRGAGGAVAATRTLPVPANGMLVLNARDVLSCGAGVCTPGSGSVDIAHTGSPEALVGSQTTLSAMTGLSFDTVFFQRRPW
jgi:hypothetical protein